MSDLLAENGAASARDKLDAQLAPLLAEIAEINRRNGFGLSGRSEVDVDTLTRGGNQVLIPRR